MERADEFEAFFWATYRAKLAQYPSVDGWTEAMFDGLQREALHDAMAEFGVSLG